MQLKDDDDKDKDDDDDDVDDEDDVDEEEDEDDDDDSDAVPLLCSCYKCLNFGIGKFRNWHWSAKCGVVTRITLN